MRNNRKGVVLTIVACLVVILLLTGLGMMRAGFHSRMQAVVATSGISATQAADAGITQAKLLMDKKLVDEIAWDNSSLPSATDIALDNSHASFSYTVAGDPSGFTITSTGISGRATKVVNVSLTVKSLWTGLSVQNNVDVKNGAAFATIPPNGDFAIITNSTAADAIGLKAGVTIPGDVVIGPGGDIDSVITDKPSTVITGETFVADEEIYYPPVILPGSLGGLTPGPYSYAAGVPLTGDLAYTSITIPNNSTQEIQGVCKIYVADDITMRNGAELTVLPGASLEIYVGTGIEAKNSTGFTNQTADAANLKIYGLPGCTDIDIKSSANFYGAVYAPSATLTVYNGADLYGAFVGDNFELKNSGNFYYDTSLSAAGIDDQAAYLSVLRWWE